jgi:hypothetical protein
MTTDDLYQQYPPDEHTSNCPGCPLCDPIRARDDYITDWTLIFASYSEPHIRVFSIETASGDAVEAARAILARHTWMDDYYLVAAIEGHVRFRRRNENHSNDPCALHPLEDP